MYLAKAKKQMEEQDMKEAQSKAEKRSESARAGSQQVKRGIGDISIGVRRGSTSSRDDFQPDDLPDGAFVSPKHTPTQMKPEEMTIVRPAEYIGSFSVCGADEDTRALQVETQLQSLQTVQQGKPVELQINLQGVQVTDSEDKSVLMHHELKRISYAACDPQHHQFSFLAREKHLNIQYCHTFRTSSPQQAEELNVIMGDAFKMAYAHQRDTLPTFHELIEAQIVEQQARFREIERQAQVELQRKLAEIARPTPFSQQAIQWMEQRKVPAEEAEPDLLVGKNKLWVSRIYMYMYRTVSVCGGVGIVACCCVFTFCSVMF
ncbi:uncharacterized protein LOC143302133 [Babylonia areolata]|uniref:uncharacterized protein LOC143302133 n=1 Tax=Babylonia areolata TaxID=304850 RepID=UPI003FD19B6E